SLVLTAIAGVVMVGSMQGVVRTCPSEEYILICKKHVGDVYPHTATNWLEMRADGSYLCDCALPRPVVPPEASDAITLYGGHGRVISAILVYTTLKDNASFNDDVVKSNSIIPLASESFNFNSEAYGVCVFVPTLGWNKGGWVGCMKHMGSDGFKAWRITQPSGLRCFTGTGQTRIPTGMQQIGSFAKQDGKKNYSCQVRVPLVP
ncbi:MAG: hypothetical protein WD068_01385, partial [Candidatus Babeliales bacterium]